MDKDCEACGAPFQVVMGRGSNNRITCYDCTSGDYKITWRNKHLKRHYGVTLYQVREMFKAQGGACKVCEKQMNFDPPNTKIGDKRGGNDMCIDHCHETGIVRGAVCFHCNTALGHVFDSTETLEKMIEYLRRSKELAE